MFARLTRRALRKYSTSDELLQQRAWVLFLFNEIGFVASAGVATLSLTYQGRPFENPDVWTALVVAGAMGVSSVLLISGRYKVAAHATIALSLAAVWTLIFLKQAPVHNRTEIAYVIAILAAPALLLGRKWTLVYGIGSLVLIFAAAAQMARIPGTTTPDAVALGIDVAVATMLVVFVTAVMTHIYEAAINRVCKLLGEQQSLNGALMELTESLDRSEAQKRQFYRETIYSVTSGKLSISDQRAIEPIVRRAELQVDVWDPESVSDARDQVRCYCSENGLEGEELDSFCIGAGEAITNSIKHANGGCVACGLSDDSVWVAVSDHGPGIESLILPKAVLLPGFSTKPSLGLGYTIMLQVADSILLKTGQTGTTLVLMKSLVKQDEEKLAAFGHTWGDW